jgi:hypothetical protein
MAYNSAKLKTITTGYAEYTINKSETLAVLLGAAYFSGVTAGTIIKITDGTFDVVPFVQTNFNFVVNGAGTLVPLGGTLTVSATATSDGTTTGTLTDLGYDFTALVTTANANNIIILPAPVVGRTITLINQSATAYELRSSAPATIAINGGTGASAESAIPASSLAVITCRTATAWHGHTITGATLAAIQAAA